MKLVVAFVASTYDLERAVLALQGAGFGRAELQWCELEGEQGPGEPHGLRQWLRRGGALGDTRTRADAASLMDGTTAGATIAALLGIVYGSTWPMGPVAGGTLGVLAGGLVGWLGDQWVRAWRTRGALAQQAATFGFLLVAACAEPARVPAAQGALREAQVLLTGVIG